MSTEKRKARTEKLLKSVGILAGEPTIDPLDYKLSLIRLLNHCNTNVDDKTRKGWIQTYLKNNDLKNLSKALSKLTDFELRQIAVLCHLVNTNQYIDDIDLVRINTFIDQLKCHIDVEHHEELIKPTVSIQDRTIELAKIHIAEIEYEIDNYAKNKKSDFSMKSYLDSNNISGSVSKKIGEFFNKTLNEFRQLLTGKDDQLVEGYSQFKKVEQKRFALFVESIVNACLQQVVVAKSARKPRKTKPIAPGKVVSKLQYLSEDKENNIKSINPTSLVDCTEAWIYNTKTRKLNVYRAVDGGTMTIKGTSLLNYDISKSLIIHLRKPSEFMRDIVIGKRALNNKIKNMKSAQIKNGRINSDCVILGAF